MKIPINQQKNNYYTNKMVFIFLFKTLLHSTLNKDYLIIIKIFFYLKMIKR